jgi:protocatechuate 3,4-dioxygenase beta subunit
MSDISLSSSVWQCNWKGEYHEEKEQLKMNEFPMSCLHD